MELVNFTTVKKNIEYNQYKPGKYELFWSNVAANAGINKRIFL